MKKGILVSVAFLLISLIAVGAMIYCGLLIVTEPDRTRYPVRGVDESYHQGESTGSP